MAWQSRHQASSGECAAASTRRRFCAPVLEGLESSAPSTCMHVFASSATRGGPGGARDLCQSSRQAFTFFPGRACTLSALVGRTAGSQCPLPNSWPGDDQTVRRPRRLCYLARLGDGLTFASVASVSPLLGQACFSEWSLMASVPGFSSIPLIFCPFRSPSLCFCSLPRAQRPVLHDFRSSDQELTLQQPRCAIRGYCKGLFSFKRPAQTC